MGSRLCLQFNRRCSGAGTRENRVLTPISSKFEAVLKWLVLWARFHTFFVSTTFLSGIPFYISMESVKFSKVSSNNFIDVCLKQLRSFYGISWS